MVCRTDVLKDLSEGEVSVWRATECPVCRRMVCSPYLRDCLDVHAYREHDVKLPGHLEQGGDVKDKPSE